MPTGQVHTVRRIPSQAPASPKTLPTISRQRIADPHICTLASNSHCRKLPTISLLEVGFEETRARRDVDGTYAGRLPTTAPQRHMLPPIRTFTVGPGIPPGQPA